MKTKVVTNTPMHEGKSEEFKKLEKRVDDMMAILKEISVNIKHAKKC